MARRRPSTPAWRRLGRPGRGRLLALYRLGRQADALRAYQQVRHILGEELGVEPTPELRKLEEQILRQSTDLAAPVRLALTVPHGWTADIVVFLFTDIEASTRRWEADQQAMATHLARHDALLLEAAEALGGEAFSHGWRRFLHRVRCRKGSLR